MTRLGVKSLWARKVRALTTALAVVIGVAFVAGTYILTDTTFAAFDEIFADSREGTSVVVTAKDLVDQETGETPSIPASLLPMVKEVRGVRLAAGGIGTPGGFFDAEGDPIGSKFAPKFITSVEPGVLQSLQYVDGRGPRTPTEASLDESAADDAGIGVGDRIELASVERAKTYRLVGLTQLGDGSTSWGGASIAELTLPEAQRITGKVGRFDQISVAAEPGVFENALKQRVERALPPTVQVETGRENADRSSEEIRSDLGFLRTALLVFAFVAVFVGAFLIFNTFSITVAQRIAEFGMLRTIGASRGQILTSVVIEALLIGVLGALLGLACGFAIAKGLNALFVAVGIDLPSTSLVLKDRTVIVSLLIGIGVTLVSSLVPALRSTRVPPIAALQALELPRSRRRITYALLAALLSAAGFAMVLVGLLGGGDSGTRASLMGAGAVAVILGVSLFSPRLVRPLASLAGLPLERLRRLTGRLARENTQRNPARTAVTAAALMIGLAVVAFVTVFAAGIKGSIASAIDENFQGELVIQNSDGLSPISPGAAAAARKLPGVEAVSTLRAAQAKLLEGSGGSPKVSALERDAANVLTIDWTQGGPAALRSLTDDEVILNESFAEKNDLRVGDTLRFLTQIGARPSLSVVGEFEDQAGLLGSAIVTHATMARDFDQREDWLDFVKVAPGASAEAVQAQLTGIVERDFPTAEVMNQQELKESQEGQINDLLNLIYALLALAIIVSLFGIANTLALSIHERTRELGMLRAIGMSRRQVRTMIRYEAVITALIGAALGMVLGVVFAALIAQPLKEEGFTLSYPILELSLVLVFAALAGVIAAIAPARRASRLNVLEALQYE